MKEAGPVALVTSGAAARAGSGEACGASGQGEANKKLTKSRSVMDPQLSPASSARYQGDRCGTVVEMRLDPLSGLGGQRHTPDLSDCPPVGHCPYTLTLASSSVSQGPT